MLLSVGMVFVVCVRVGAKGATFFASARDVEALLRVDLIVFVVEFVKLIVWVVENGLNFVLDDVEFEKM